MIWNQGAKKTGSDLFGWVCFSTLFCFSVVWTFYSQLAKTQNCLVRVLDCEEWWKNWQSYNKKTTHVPVTRATQAYFQTATNSSIGFCSTAWSVMCFSLCEYWTHAVTHIRQSTKWLTNDTASFLLISFLLLIFLQIELSLRRIQDVIIATSRSVKHFPHSTKRNWCLCEVHLRLIWAPF